MLFTTRSIYPNEELQDANNRKSYVNIEEGSEDTSLSLIDVKSGNVQGSITLDPDTIDEMIKALQATKEDLLRTV